MGPCPPGGWMACWLPGAHPPPSWGSHSQPKRDRDRRMGRSIYTGTSRATELIRRMSYRMRAKSGEAFPLGVNPLQTPELVMLQSSTTTICA